MKKTKLSKGVKADNTEALISASEARLAELNENLKAVKDSIKAEEKNLAELNERLKQEKLNDIGSIAEKAGVSIDDLLSAIKDGTVLSLIAEPSNAKEDDTDEDEETDDNVEDDTDNEEEDDTTPEDNSSSTNTSSYYSSYSNY